MPLDDRLTPCAHPGGTTVAMPYGWEVTTDARPGLLLVAVQPAAPGRTGRPGGRRPGFQANVVVTAEDLPDGADLAGWQDGLEQMLPTMLQRYRLVGRERVVLSSGRAAEHRVATHRSAQGTDVTMAQWTVVADDGRGCSLTGSATSRAYPRMAGLFEAVAASWEPVGTPSD